jgi:hypothetical protein
MSADQPEEQELEYKFAFDPPEPSGQIIEAASWRLTAEIVRRYPGRFAVIETHPGGGQYDCISLIDQDEKSNLRCIDLNRVGGVWVHKRDGSHWAWRGSWLEMLAVENPMPLLDRLCQRSGLQSMGHLPSSTRTVVTYRVIAAFLTNAVFGRVKYECRNGCLDSSGGFGGGPREEYFEHFPAARTRLKVHETYDVLAEPAYRFWFLLKGDKPRVAIEAARGLAWDSEGRTTDLYAVYSAHHKIWPAVLKVAGHLMP